MYFTSPYQAQTHRHHSSWRRTKYNQRPCTSLPRTRPPQCSSWCPCHALRSARSIPFHRGVVCSCRGQGCTGPPTSARSPPSPRPTPSPSCPTPPAGPAPPPLQSSSSGRCEPSQAPLVPHHLHHVRRLRLARLLPLCNPPPQVVVGLHQFCSFLPSEFLLLCTLLSWTLVFAHGVIWHELTVVHVWILSPLVFTLAVWNGAVFPALHADSVGVFGARHVAPRSLVCLVRVAAVVVPVPPLSPLTAPPR